MKLLTDYEIKAPERIISRLKEDNKALAVISTGLANIATAGRVIDQYFTGKGAYRTLYLCDNNDYLMQAEEQLSTLFSEKEIEVARMYGGLNQESDSLKSITFASLQNLSKNNEWKNRFIQNYFDLVIVDRVHLAVASSFLPTLQYFIERDVPMFGMTTSPNSEIPKELTSLLGKSIVNVSFEEIITMGCLNSFSYHVMNDNFNKQKLEEIINYEKHDGVRPTLSKINKTLFIEQRDDQIIDQIIEHTQASEKVLIFCENLKHSEHIHKIMHDKIKDIPLIAYQYNSDISESSKETVLEGYKGNPRVKFLLAVDMLHEYVDLPQIDTLVFLRGTDSKKVFYNQLNIGLRKTRKEHQVDVLDFVANVDRLMAIKASILKYQKIAEENGLGSNPPSLSISEHSSGNNISENSENVLGNFNSSNSHQDESADSNSKKTLKPKNKKEIVTIHGTNFNFIFSEQVMEAIEVVAKIKEGYYPSIEEAMAVAQGLGFKNEDEYKVGYRQDIRLHKNPETYYSDFVHYQVFLAGPLSYFYLLSGQEQIDNIKRFLEKREITSYDSLVSRGSSILTSGDFGVFGNGLSFTGIILNRKIISIDPIVLVEVGEKLRWMNSTKTISIEV